MRNLVCAFMISCIIINGIKVDVKDSDNNVLWSDVMVRDMTDVFHLKQIMIDIVKAPISHQKIYLMDGTLIEDTFDLKGLRNGNDKIQVMITTWIEIIHYKERIKIEFNNNLPATFGHLKWKIKTQIGVPLVMQNLIFMGTLENSDLLENLHEQRILLRSSDYFRAYQTELYGCGFQDGKRVFQAYVDMTKLGISQMSSIESFIKSELKLSDDENVYLFHQNRISGHIYVVNRLHFVDLYNQGFDPDNGDLLYFVVMMNTVETSDVEMVINNGLKPVVEVLGNGDGTMDMKFIFIRHDNGILKIYFRHSIWPKIHDLKNSIKERLGIPVKLQQLTGLVDGQIYLKYYYTMELNLIKETDYFRKYQQRIDGYGVNSFRKDSIVRIPSDATTVNDVKHLIKVHYNLGGNHYVYLFHRKDDKSLRIVNELDFIRLKQENFDPDNGDKLFYWVSRKGIQCINGIIINVEDCDNNVLWSDIMIGDMVHVLALKQRLVSIVKAPVSHQRIYSVGGVLMDDDIDLKALNNGYDYVTVIIKTWIVINHYPENIEIVFDNNFPATFGDLRLKLKRKTKLPLRIQKVFAKKNLRDSDSLQNIYPEWLILITECFNYFKEYQLILNGIQLKGNTNPSQSFIHLSHLPDQQSKTIPNILSFIQDALKLPPNVMNIYVFHQNKKTGKIYVVNDIDFIRLYDEGFDPDNGDVLYYVISSNNIETSESGEIIDSNDDLKYIVENLDGGFMPIYSKFILIEFRHLVHRFDFGTSIWPTIYDLKNEIKSRLGIPLKLQYLQNTEDSDYLKHYYSTQIILAQKKNYFREYQQKIYGYGVTSSNKVVTIPSNAKTVDDVKERIRVHHNLLDNYYVYLFHRNDGNTISIVNELNFIKLKQQMFDPDNNDKLYYFVCSVQITKDDDPFVQHINEYLTT